PHRDQARIVSLHLIHHGWVSLIDCAPGPSASAGSEHLVRIEIDPDFLPRVVFCWGEHRVRLTLHDRPYSTLDHGSAVGIARRGLELRARGEGAVLFEPYGHLNDQLAAGDTPDGRDPAASYLRSERIELAH